MFKTMPGFRYEKNIRRLRQIERPGRKLGGVNKVGREVFKEERLGCEAGDCKLRYSYVRYSGKEKIVAKSSAGFT